MTTANKIGVLGIALLLAVWPAGLSVTFLTPRLAVTLLTLCVVAFGLGLFAAIRGRKWWLLEPAFALFTAAFVLFGLIGE